MSGTVTVANMPSVQSVSVVSGGVDIGDTSVQIAGGTFTLTDDGVLGGRFLGPDDLQPRPDVLSGADHALPQAVRGGGVATPDHADLCSTTDHDMRLTCRLNGAMIWTMESSTNVSHEFTHPLVADDCYLQCNATLPDLECPGTASVAGITGSLGGGGFETFATITNAPGGGGTTGGGP